MVVGGGKWWTLNPNSGWLRQVVVGGSKYKHGGSKCEWWMADASGGWRMRLVGGDKREW